MNANRRIHLPPWARTVVFILLALLVAWVGSMAVMTGLLLSRANRLRQMAVDPTHIPLSVVAREVHGARQQFSILHTELSPLLWLSSKFHGDVGAVKPMADAGNQLLIAADEMLATVNLSLTNVELSSLSAAQLPLVLETLQNAEPVLEKAQTHVDAAAEDLQLIPGNLSPRMTYLSSLAEKAMTYARIGFEGARLAPNLLGQSGPRTYLLLLQNSDELRATGGFITAVGIVKVDHGKLVDISLQDSYALEDFKNWHPDPPKPLLEYMLSEQWVLWDANWSPDFPTAAQDAINLYHINHTEQIDGVIGLTVQGVQMFIGGLSPLEVPGLMEPITPANLPRILQASWNPEPDLGDSTVDLKNWWLNRKQAIGLIMTAALDKVLHGQADWPQLAQGILKSLEERQLMVYTPAEADALKRMLWDGSFHPTSGDYLMVVDSNVGFNKVNPLVHETMDYQVTLQTDGTARSIVNVNYAHQGKQPGIVCQQFKKFDKNITYEQLRQSCYYDYLRLVVPLDSNLINATPQPTSAQYLLPGVPTSGLASMLQDESLGKAMISQFFVLVYGKQLQTHFEYTLPKVVQETSEGLQYTLYLQKQPGTDALPATIAITLPAGGRLISAYPAPITSVAGRLTIDVKLDTDKQLRVVYKLDH